MRKKRYSTEFKREAARLMIIDGVNPSEAAQRLGVNVSLLYRWKQEHLEEQDASKGDKPGVGAVELAAEDVRLAARALARVTGRIGAEDILDVVFSSFCIGK